MEIKDLSLFQELSEDEIERSIHCSDAKVRDYEKNAYVFCQGDRPKRVYFVLQGDVVLGQLSAAGRWNYIEYLKEGQSFGEKDLFLEHESYAYFAVAKTRARVLSISKHFFYSTCAKNCAHHSKIIFNMLRIFANEADKMSQKLYLLTCGSLRQRVAYYLMRQSGGKEWVKLPMKREDLATYLNTTRPSLSRELSYLKDCGVITITDRSHIHILNFKQLQDEVDGVGE